VKVAIPREIEDNERRIAATPETVKKLIAAGLEISVESGAGEACSFSDEDYETAGASVANNVKSLLSSADLTLKVHKPLPNKALGCHEVDLLKEGSILIAFLQPRLNSELLEKLNARKIKALSMDAIPRIARAQKLDALSSQANVAGYKSVLMASNALGKLMPLMMTAAGTIPPAKVLVIGAGVAGLQAIATAKRLGAIVEAFDTRPVVKDQVESLGGKFLQLEIQEQQTEDKGGYAKELSKESHDKELELIAAHSKISDIVITTAQIPGKQSPTLITEDTVRQMKAGSVIVDLAVEGGGNCTLSEPGRDVVKHGVIIIGRLNVPSLMPAQSSSLYARNMMNLVFEFYKDGKVDLDLENEVIKGALITLDGKVIAPSLATVPTQGGVK
jgi:H+-translocating NAD(P) transhydrogenase subunit alpha